jgi:hypothetical protein
MYLRGTAPIYRPNAAQFIHLPVRSPLAARLRIIVGLWFEMESTLTRYANTLAITAGGLDPSSKLEPEEAGDLRELKEVFKIETINKDTFLSSAVAVDPTASGNPEKGSFTGEVTCSLSFSAFLSFTSPQNIMIDISINIAAPDGCGQVAIGCAEGIWVGSRDDPQCKF